MKSFILITMLFSNFIFSDSTEKENIQSLAKKIWIEADSYYENKDYIKAKNLYLVLIELSNKNPHFYYNLAGIYKNENQPKLALSFFLKSHQLNPEDPEVIFGIIDCKFELKNYESLESYIKLFEKKSPQNNCIVTNFYAKYYDETNNINKALKHYTKFNQNCSHTSTKEYLLFIKQRIKDLE